MSLAQLASNEECAQTFCCSLVGLAGTGTANNPASCNGSGTNMHNYAMNIQLYVKIVHKICKYLDKYAKDMHKLCQKYA